ncbi:MAG: DUF86 domain-containing protein [Phycisphaeraceae bacterium]|nr:DUF86 domain-containing protein [Phycisphaeraceae bacterium]
MRRDKRDIGYLWDMLDAARTAVTFTSGKTFEEYLHDRLLRLAVERLVEIIGEAARKVSPEFRAQHPEIPWPKIVAQRHVLVHEYDDIQDNLIWQVATQHAAELIRLLKPLVPPPPPSPES